MTDYTTTSTLELERELDMIEAVQQSYTHSGEQKDAATEDKRLIEAELKRRFSDATKTE